MSFDKEYMDEFLELENRHLFGNTSFKQYNNEENEESLEEALIRSHQFGDGFCEMKDLDSLDSDDNDPFNFLYSNKSYEENRKKLFGNKIDNEEQIKSWLINLETKETKLVISDIDDGEIPEILKDYDWLIELEIDCQKIKEIKNLPKNLKEISLFNNQIEKIPENELPNGLEILNLSRNKIRVLENIPKSVKELDVSHNLIKICVIKENINLFELSIESNLLNIFPDLPNSVKKIDISQNLLTEIKDIVDSIEELDFSVNNITQVTKLPENLKRLNGYNNKIKLIIKYPSNIEYIDMSYNELIWIPKLPESLKKSDFSNNKINIIALYNDNNEIDNTNGKLTGNFSINLCFNPLTKVPIHILRNPRVKHNSSVSEEEISISIKEYYKISHYKTLIL
jgi:Leucine-rich repeat (LRR) protein